jgi:hypothetical protein
MEERHVFCENKYGINSLGSTLMPHMYVTRCCIYITPTQLAIIVRNTHTMHIHNLATNPNNI